VGEETERQTQERWGPTVQKGCKGAGDGHVLHNEALVEGLARVAQVPDAGDAHANLLADKLARVVWSHPNGVAGVGPIKGEPEKVAVDAKALPNEVADREPVCLAAEEDLCGADRACAEDESRRGDGEGLGGCRLIAQVLCVDEPRGARARNVLGIEHTHRREEARTVLCRIR
jgi:hypothetical protein